MTNKQMFEEILAILKTMNAKPTSTAMGTPGKPSGGQIAPPIAKPAPEVWSIAPEPGTEDEYPEIDCPSGYHIMYDWTNKAVKINKDCVPCDKC